LRLAQRHFDPDRAPLSFARKRRADSDASSNSSAAKKLRREDSCVARTVESAQFLAGHCLTNAKHFCSLEDLLPTIVRFRSLSRSERRQSLLTAARSRLKGYYGFALSMSHDGNEQVFNLCNLCFAHTQGASKSSVQRAIKFARDGDVIALPDVPRRHVAVETNDAHAWLADKAANYGDYMPDSETIVLPVFTKLELYNWYLTSTTDSTPIARSSFYHLLSSKFPFIRWRRHKPFCQCTFCHNLDQHISRNKVMQPIFDSCLCCALDDRHCHVVREGEKPTFEVRELGEDQVLQTPIQKPVTNLFQFSKQ
jgi:hypothetical protein